MSRIVFVEDRFDDVYGAQVNALLLAEACTRDGHDVSVISTGAGSFVQAARRRGLDATSVEIPRQLRRLSRVPLLANPATWVRTVAALVPAGRLLHRAVADVAPDVVVANSLRAALMLWMTACRRRHPVVLWVQNDIPFGFRAVVAGLLARRIGLISPESRNTFPPVAQRCLARRFRPLPSGRDFDRFAARSAPPDRDGVQVVTVCSITPRKRIHDLIEAVALSGVDEISVVVVGSTISAASEEYLASLRRRAQELGVDVRFTGWQEDVRHDLADADVFVLASENEGLPGVLLEAMAVGVACVVTRAGAAGEIVDECGAGVAVSIGDVAALSEAIRSLAADRAWREACGRRAAANVRGRFGIDQSYRAFMEIVREVLLG